jgi:hypothetical protein
MHEFNNRINTQREVLKIVNSNLFKEDLFGLSRKSIERWANSNSILPDNDKCALLYKIADKLFFLATKSQEQISNEYKSLSNDVNQLINSLRVAFNN